jgi:hypothetical protein
VRVFSYVAVIVVIGKFKIPHLPEDQQGAQYQGTINENNDISLHEFGHTCRIFAGISHIIISQRIILATDYTDFTVYKKEYSHRAQSSQSV